MEDDAYVIKGLEPLGSLPEISVGQLIYEHLLGCPDGAAMVDANTKKSISYKEILSKSCSLAQYLKKRGYTEATIISICSENSIKFFIPVVAALFIGAPIAPVNHNFTQTELIHSFNVSKPKVIFCSKQIYPKVLEIKKKLQFINELVILDGAKNENNSLESIVAENVIAPETLKQLFLTNVNLDNQIAFITYSSGTTGLPKGVMITQTNVLVRIMHLDDPRLTPQEPGRCAQGLLPFYHAYGLFVGLGAIYKSIKLVVINRFEEKLFLQSIEKYKISGLALVPPLAILLAKSPNVDSYDLSSLKYVNCAAAPLSKDIEEILKHRLKVNTIRQAYGLSETTLAVTIVCLDDDRSGSVGKVISYSSCKIRDPETGKSLGPNQIGEICVKGASVMKGYYGNEEATRNTFTSDGWLLTGDLGYYDNEEYFFIVGRLKELIKYKGYQVAPAELEAVLLTNPKIKDVAVIGIPNEATGELPAAFIVPQPKSELSKDEVKSFLAGKVSSYKHLRGGVIFVDEIPKSPSGKILRRQLQNLVPKYFSAKL